MMKPDLAWLSLVFDLNPAEGLCWVLVSQKGPLLLFQRWNWRLAVKKRAWCSQSLCLDLYNNGELFLGDNLTMVVSGMETFSSPMCRTHLCLK